LDVIHRKIMPAFMDAHVVDRDDIRVLKDGGGGGLSPKTLHELLAGERPRLNHLHRHDAPEFPLPGLINDSHAASRNLFQEIVIAERSQWRTLRAQWRWLEASGSGRRFRLDDLACRVGHVERSLESA